MKKFMLLISSNELQFKSLKKWAGKTENIYDDAIINILERDLIPIAYIASFYLAVGNLVLHPILQKTINVMVVMVATIFGIRLISAASEYLIKTQHNCLVLRARHLEAKLPELASKGLGKNGAQSLMRHDERTLLKPYQKL